MGTLRYSTSMSIDGYIADEKGDFQWSAPSAEVFDFHLERMRETSLEIIGRKTYELMSYWEDPSEESDWTPVELAFARYWRGLHKIVLSSQLTEADMRCKNDRLVSSICVDEIKQLVEEASGVVEIFGPTTAAEAIRAGIVDVLELLTVPVLVGGGLKALPEGATTNFRLTKHQVFANGVSVSRYARVG